jgi:hypothetical protein
MKVAQKRELELKRLVETRGIEIIRLSRWHYRIGPIHLWLAVGRWANEETGWHGKINRMSLGELLDRYSARVANSGLR